MSMSMFHDHLLLPPLGHAGQLVHAEADGVPGHRRLRRRTALASRGDALVSAHNCTREGDALETPQSHARGLLQRRASRVM
eukprot:6730039-Prymnesium_polylepis.2